jgi:PKHD-type hydroxylase
LVLVSAAVSLASPDSKEGAARVIVIVEKVLVETELIRLRSDLGRVDFATGADTAGWAARLMKNNEQAAPDPCVEVWRERIAEVLHAHPVFALAARPKRIIGPMLSRYRAGHSYGRHVDEPIMDGSRADLSFTLFLDDPDAYGGGELIIETSAGEDAFKLPAGSLVLYPALTLHRVATVTQGERRAAVGWVRSLVRDAAQRELLFELDTAKQRMFEVHGKSPEFDLISRCAANLMRMWSED